MVLNLETASKFPKLYLISPPQIELPVFLPKLEEALKTRQVAVFQLRLKNISDAEIISKSKKILDLCYQYQVPFILNDRLDLALKVGADGVHLGDEDGDIGQARKNAPKNFIIGASCYDSKDRIMEAAEGGADYVALGAFYETTTKKAKGKPTLELLKWCDDFINLPIVAIGGINNENYQILARNGADFIAVISYIWNHKNGVKYAIESFKLNNLPNL